MDCKKQFSVIEKDSKTTKKNKEAHLKSALITRFNRSFKLLLERLDIDSIQKIVEAPSDFQMFIDVVKLPELPEILSHEDPLNEARVRGAEMREKLLNTEGGLKPVNDVAKYLHITRQAVDKRRKGNHLIGLDLGRRGYLYPAWQFTENGTLPGLEEVLDDLKEESPIGKITFFLNGSHRLGGRSPLEELRRSEIEHVRRAARAYGKHGAA